MILVEFRNRNCGVNCVVRVCSPQFESIPTTPYFMTQTCFTRFHDMSKSCRYVSLWPRWSLLGGLRQAAPAQSGLAPFLEFHHLNFHTICLAFQTCPVAGYFSLGAGAPFRRQMLHTWEGLSTFSHRALPLVGIWVTLAECWCHGKERATPDQQAWKYPWAGGWGWEP